MISPMPKKLPPHVQHERTRHGKMVYYFRLRGGSRTRLPELRSPEFGEAYLNALNNVAVPKKRKPRTKSLAWLVAQYLQCSSFTDLSPSTRKRRMQIFAHVLKGSGESSFSNITQKHIVDGRERRKESSAQARAFLDTMRGLFRWAMESQYISIDPTANVLNPKIDKSTGFLAWTEEDVAQYEAYWAAGTCERVWMHVLLHTGLRRGDAVVLGYQHIKNGIAIIKTGKTGEEVYIPILPELKETLDLGPTGDLHLIVGKAGHPLTKESFGNMFRKACNKAGLTNKAAHGLRKIGAVRAAEAGATVAELESRFGWTGGRMASLYTRSANRKKLAIQASEKLEKARKENNDVPHLSTSVPHLGKKI